MTAEPNRPRVLIDCDPGHDDAVAILLASQTCDIVAITAVNGNAPLEWTSRNALLITQIAELDIPVFSGAEDPLVQPRRNAAGVHGRTGLDGPEHPALTRELAGTDAVAAIVAASHEHDDLWLVAVGPLTNVALALRADPGLAGRIGGISIMGGAAAVGNVTATAEFNIWADPEAAAVVFGAGVTLRMAGLDVTSQFTVDDQVIAHLRSLDRRAATFVAELFEFYCASYERNSGTRQARLHDPVAVLALTHPELVQWTDRHVTVELQGRHTRGMTVVDDRAPGLVGEEPNVSVLRSIDRERGLGVIMDALRRLP